MNTADDTPTGYRIIRASRSYNPVILVTPPDAAGSKSPDVRYYEYNTWKESPGWDRDAFNEISRREAMLAFHGMADAWGYPELPDRVFVSLEEALGFVTEPRVPRF